MQQDFLYITKLGIYEANRGLKATNTLDFETSMDRVGKRAKYAKDHLKMCTTAPPNGLGIEESTILATPETEALQQYVALLLDAADKENWVMSVVAMIPCIQVSPLSSYVHGLLISGSLTT
jgi:thiaminase